MFRVVSVKWAADHTAVQVGLCWTLRLYCWTGQRNQQSGLRYASCSIGGDTWWALWIAQSVYDVHLSNCLQTDEKMVRLILWNKFERCFADFSSLHNRPMFRKSFRFYVTW